MLLQRELAALAELQHEIVFVTSDAPDVCIRCFAAMVAFRNLHCNK